MNLEDCLPAELRGPGTTIARVPAGQSGAGVYRVDAGGEAYVLKVTGEDEPLDRWRRALHIRRLAADAGLAPRVVHVDEGRRAVLSAFVVDRSFPAFYRDPGTHEAALAQLGRTLRRVHQLPLPADADARDPRAFLAESWSTLGERFAVPAFVGDAVRRALAEEPPAGDRPAEEDPLVLSHNDVNPTNVVYDGERLLFFDWEMAGPNDRYYDLATVSLFLRMDAETCLGLLSAYEGAPVGRLPARFLHYRRFVAALCGAMFMRLARDRGHAGAAGGETLDTTPTLGELYGRMRTGALSLATAEGQWWFGMALVREGATL